MSEEVQHEDRGFKIVVRVIQQEGHCAAGHQVGDEVFFDGQTVEGKVCMHALYSFLPKVFALNEDLYELVNLAHNAAYRAERRRLQERLARWIAETSDSFALPEL